MMAGPKKDRPPLREPHIPESLNTGVLNVGSGLNVSSATDFTGLIPASPASNEILNNYEELYPLETDPPEKKR